jgi:hypothetical protein
MRAAGRRGQLLQATEARGGIASGAPVMSLRRDRLGKKGEKFAGGTRDTGGSIGDWRDILWLVALGISPGRS